MNGFTVAPSDPNSIYLTGSFSGTLQIGSKTYPSAGGSDIFLAKFDAKGASVWSQAFGSPQADSASSVAVNVTGDVAFSGSNGAPITIGTTVLPAAGGFTAVFDSAGAPIWTEASASGYATFDPSGNLFVGGRGVELMKFDPMGGDLWHKTFTNTTGMGTTVFATALDWSTGNVVIAGTIYGTISFGLPPLSGNSNAFIAEFQY